MALFLNVAREEGSRERYPRDKKFLLKIMQDDDPFPPSSRHTW